MTLGYVGWGAWATMGLVMAWFFVMRFAQRSIWQMAIINLPGTAAHELAHFLVGALLLAKPQSFSLIPHRQEGGWQLGSVKFTGLNILTAAPVAYAPLLLAGIAWLMFNGWAVPAFHAARYLSWVISGYAIASALYSCWPSSTDVKLGGLSIILWVILSYGFWLLENYPR